jgi:hypothetical protein
LAAVLSWILAVAAGRIVEDSVSGALSMEEGDSTAPVCPRGSLVYAAPISPPLARADIVLLAIDKYLLFRGDLENIITRL